MSQDLPSIRVIDVIDNPDGTATVNLDLSDEFIDWFKGDQGLTRFSKKRFNKWFLEVLEENVTRLEKERESSTSEPLTGVI